VTRRDETGYTLIEVLVVMLLTSILLTLTAAGLRHFWLVQSLESASGEIVSEVRQTQEQAVSETHPGVFGVYFRVGATDWGVVKYDPRFTPLCKYVDSRKFATGVKVTAASFTVPADSTAVKNACASLTGNANDKFAFFFARGSATPGTVTILQPSLNRSRTLTISPITGRIEES
jgi:prepilin-type N-terminal cleavage/methylation domain-containing protein